MLWNRRRKNRLSTDRIFFPSKPNLHKVVLVLLSPTNQNATTILRPRNSQKLLAARPLPLPSHPLSSQWVHSAAKALGFRVLGAWAASKLRVVSVWCCLPERASGSTHTVRSLGDRRHSYGALFFAGCGRVALGCRGCCFFFFFFFSWVSGAREYP